MRSRSSCPVRESSAGPSEPSASASGAVEATVRNDARPPVFVEADCGSLTHNIGLVVGPNLGAKCSPSGS
jgi:hypothetical protein